MNSSTMSNRAQLSMDHAILPLPLAMRLQYRESNRRMPVLVCARTRTRNISSLIIRWDLESGNTQTPLVRSKVANASEGLSVHIWRTDEPRPSTQSSKNLSCMKTKDRAGLSRSPLSRITSLEIQMSQNLSPTFQS